MVFLYDQFHAVQYFFMGGGAYRYINARCFNAAVPKYIRQMRQVPLNGIEGAGKKVPQVMRKHLMGRNLRRRAQFLHLMTDIGAIHGAAGFCTEDMAGFNAVRPGIPQQPVPQFLLQDNGAVFAFHADLCPARFCCFHCNIHKLADTDPGAAYRLHQQIKPLVSFVPRRR